MKRIKVLLAVVAAVATMMVLAAPAMADIDFGGGGNSISGGSIGSGDTGFTLVGGTGGTGFVGDGGRDFVIGPNGVDFDDLDSGGSIQFCICPGARSVSFDDGDLFGFGGDIILVG
jgi:hypothetical protein